MIPTRYRAMLPPYWYEDQHAEQHFALAEEVMDMQADQNLNRADEYVLQRATSALDVWDWIYFRKSQPGTYAQRREAIRQKRLAKRPFTLTTLRLLASKYGLLNDIRERCAEGEIDFIFEAARAVDLNGLNQDFEYIRPVHINRHVPIIQNTPEMIQIQSKAYYHAVDFPICGLESPFEAGTSGQLVSETIMTTGTGHYFGIDSPIAGLETARGEES